jgi:glutamate-5-semialdehyde dehydrogenase
MTTNEILNRAVSAKSVMSLMDSEQKNLVLTSMADFLVLRKQDILAANKIDIENAKGKISEVMIDRLRLSEERIFAMAEGIRQVAKLPDPVGKILKEHTCPNGLKVKRVSVPMGVVAIIYESRPNVTSDAAALAIKSGNVPVLRGGKEAYNSSKAIVTALKEGIQKVNANSDIINIIDDTTRQSANELMTAVGKVDLLIPRGGKGLISACVENATVPCIETGTGICHIYVDKSADIEKALKIVENAKMSRPSVCNAAEVCLVHKSIANEFLPRLKDLLTSGERPQKAQLRLDTEAIKIIDGTPASLEDFDTEFLDYILAVKVVENIEQAIEHIAKHSTHHSEAIVAEDKDAQSIFSAAVDSAAVYLNSSTRFTDGGEFGLGCEMGISTQKLHARGPMGLEELTTYKYIITGNGQIRG